MLGAERKQAPRAAHIKCAQFAAEGRRQGCAECSIVQRRQRIGFGRRPDQRIVAALSRQQGHDRIGQKTLPTGLCVRLPGANVGHQTARRVRPGVHVDAGARAHRRAGAVAGHHQLAAHHPPVVQHQAEAVVVMGQVNDAGTAPAAMRGQRGPQGLAQHRLRRDPAQGRGPRFGGSEAQRAGPLGVPHLHVGEDLMGGIIEHPCRQGLCRAGRDGVHAQVVRIGHRRRPLFDHAHVKPGRGQRLRGGKPDHAAPDHGDGPALQAHACRP